MNEAAVAGVAEQEPEPSEGIMSPQHCENWKYCEDVCNKVYAELFC